MSKSRSLNKALLIGNLTRNPVLRETANGVMVCTFGIATNTSWKDKSGNVKEKAEYHNLIAFNKLAEICAQVLSVGMLVYVEGEIRNKVIDGQDGKKYYRTEIKLNDMILIDSKGKKGVGIDAAREEQGSSQHVSDVETPAAAAEEIEAVVPVTEDDELNSSDLF